MEMEMEVDVEVEELSKQEKSLVVAQTLSLQSFVQKTRDKHTRE